jgi:hypothetical protein
MGVIFCWKYFSLIKHGVSLICCKNIQSSLYEHKYYEMLIVTNFYNEAHNLLSSLSESKLAHPKSSDQNRTRVNENANEVPSYSRSAKAGEVREALGLTIRFVVHLVKN